MMWMVEVDMEYVREFNIHLRKRLKNLMMDEIRFGKGKNQKYVLDFYVG